ncbi:CKLF-like MARVEL transmembrane domain-containing protein 6 [Oryzias latipes]|uniref:MARVEL domain-containing protein n=1 Tax=Oryzias latipes TaxID=8090 RepID=H2MQZ9_ORYLA|nr:CKLF-like MARVEL transmembrane domain-containing protein 6 [Oryzias latipes]XP_011484170.1 CKLF-like MARVEL transmembrane domain-containing protein 6 [Oryzias latipes]XP_011484173.1 CKLF-like MARVEL transmembrane domain-containing protein 6 [Oryzias latipes]XP_011484174.1 CKLF-like MARVEL transmembrane domain-containing protein 6 [Oryzias latipes]XP_020566194.1 CKLF-like MARVEL transmembrane domain-containing protein 6 [Oryzias latipes]XP_020566195.1 CKLF-like MARVEL transmembrane domain-co
MTEVYAPTTVSNPKSSWFLVPSKLLDKVQFGLKAAEVGLSLVAFILEELVSSCGNCNPLYFFEFVSCTAFLFTLLLLILLSTRLHEKVGIECWPKLNFLYTVGIAVLLLISSIVLAADNAGSSLERVAVVFGVLATLAFALDVAYFLKTRGSPFKAGPGPGVSNGGPVPAAAPETERLNDQA